MDMDPVQALDVLRQVAEQHACVPADHRIIQAALDTLSKLLLPVEVPDAVDPG